MDCERCHLLESVRYERIREYCDVFEERKHRPAMAAELASKIDAVERQLNQAWQELDLHRRTHAVSAAKA